MLFASVGALKATGVMGVVGGWLIHITGGSPRGLVLTVGWATGWFSGLLDNMLAVSSFLPIVAEVKSRGANCPAAIYWLMLFGGTFMGNMTTLGSTCNIIACGMIVKRGHPPVGFIRWFKIGVIISLASMGLATVLLAMQTSGLSKG